MLEQIKIDFKQGKQNHFRGIDGLMDAQVKWLIEQTEKAKRIEEDSQDAKFAIDMIESESKKYRQTIDFLKLKLVDFERQSEAIRRLADNELIKVEAKRLSEDISDTFKAVEQENLITK